jgi:hypothetical protein
MAAAGSGGWADDLGEGEGSASGSEFGLSAARGRGGAEPLTLDPDGTDVLIRAPSQIGEGATLVTETRILPRANAPATPVTEVDPRYEAQLEAVMSKEEYPLHLKETVRRYFLSLGRGVAAGGEEGGAAR